MSSLAEVQAEIEDVEQRLEDVNRKVGDARDHALVTGPPGQSC